MNKLIFDIITPIITTIIGFLAGNYFAVRRDRRKEFNKAASDFRAAFIEEIRFIDQTYAVDRAGKDIPEVLAAAADSHEHALIIFKKFLSKGRRTNIEKAWKEYTGEKKLMGKYTFDQYVTYGKIKDAGNIRKLALSRIEKLLEFADPKY
jgi:hypothetical protein